MKTKIDATDVRIVEELRKNARITMKELGARVFLTGQAVRNRVERLEDMGISSAASTADFPRAATLSTSIARSSATRSMPSSGCSSGTALWRP